VRILSAEDPAAINEAARILRRGGVAAFPTDTVYGLGAHSLNSEAIERLYLVKGRPRTKAIALLLSEKEEMAEVAKDIPEVAWYLGERFWPGGLTLVLALREGLPEALSAGGRTIGVRVPAHAVALSLIRAVGAPLATTSANLSGRPSPTLAQEVARELGEQVDLLLDGGPCPGGVPSTVLDLTQCPPRILRQGAIPQDALMQAIAKALERKE